MSKKKKKTDIWCLAEGAEDVFVAGDFNQWSKHATPLMKERDGKWSIKLDLPAGRYEYKFIVDGEWCCDPSCQGCTLENRDCKHCVVNKFGSMNRVLVIE